VDKFEARGDKVTDLRPDSHLHVANLGDQLLEVGLHHRFQASELLSVNLFFHSLDPGLDKRLPAKVDGLEVNHTATGDRSGRGNLQVIDLEHHSASVGHSDTLTVIQTKHLVVIKHSVHVLNPESIHRAVETDPSLPMSVGSFSLSDSILDKL